MNPEVSAFNKCVHEWWRKIKCIGEIKKGPVHCWNIREGKIINQYENDMEKPLCLFTLKEL